MPLVTQTIIPTFERFVVENQAKLGLKITKNQSKNLRGNQDYSWGFYFIALEKEYFHRLDQEFYFDDESGMCLCNWSSDQKLEESLQQLLTMLIAEYDVVVTRRGGKPSDHVVTLIFRYGMNENTKE